MLAGSCFGHPFFNIPLGPLPLTARSAAAGRTGGDVSALSPLGMDRSQADDEDRLCPAAFLLVLDGQHGDARFSILNASQPLTQLVFLYLMPAASVLGGSPDEFTDAARWWLFASLAVFGVYLCVTAFAETQQAWTLV